MKLLAQGAIITVFAVTWLKPQALIDGTIMLGAFRVTLAQAAWLPYMSGVCAVSLIWFMGYAAVEIFWYGIERRRS